MADGLEPRGESPLWFRLNMAPYGDMPPGATIFQHVTYSAECGLPP